MLAILKTVAHGVSVVLVAPSLVSFALRSALLGRDRALQGSTQAYALLPGLIGNYLRRAFLAHALARCDRTAAVGFGVIFSKSSASIAEDVVIGARCHVGWVSIGRGALVGPGCHLLSGAHTHGTGDPALEVREQEGELREVRIGAGAWIGSSSVVMADIGEGAVIAAGSVVHEAVPPNVIAGGVPARVLKRRGPAPRESIRSAL